MFVPATPTETPSLAAASALAPLATAFSVGGAHELRRRYDSASLSELDSCYARVAALSCDGPYLSCLSSVGSDFATLTSYGTPAVLSEETELTSCYCAYGAPYISCYLSALTESGCSRFYEGYDYTSYESDWFSQYCGSVPATLFADAGPTTTVDQKQIPSTVSLDFESVTTTTLTSTPPPSAYTYSPLFASTANLLRGECASTRFNLLEDVGTVYWAAYAGCGNDMPQCCPWMAASTALQGLTSKTATTTTTTTTTPTAALANANNVFPVPANSHDATLRRCPADYTAVAGQCCPSSYWPFTRALGGQTPCYSSLPATTEAPVLTVGLVGQPTATQKPTSAVVNVVWAMSYPAATGHGGRIHGGRIAGIVIGVLVAVLLLVDVAVYAFFQWKRGGGVSARSVAVGWVQPRPWWPSRGAKQPQPQPQPQQQPQKQEPQQQEQIPMHQQQPPPPLYVPTT